MGRRTFLSALAVVALLAAGLGLWAATPAMAATKPIGLSLDGVTFTDTLPSSLYDGSIVVPGDDLLRSFYVQNRAADAGNLAVALQDVTGADGVMISSLWVRAAAASSTGPMVNFTWATPCRPLVNALTIPPGGVVRVDLTLRFGSAVSGLAAQGSVGTFNLGITLTSTDVAAPTGCAAVTPPTGGGTGGGGHGGHATTPGEIDTAVVSGAADGNVPGATHDNACYVGDQHIAATEDSFPGQAGVGCQGVAAAIIQPNTGRFYQEYDVVAWMALVGVGGIFAAWRRSRDPEDVYAPEETYA